MEGLAGGESRRAFSEAAGVTSPQAWSCEEGKVWYCENSRESRAPEKRVQQRPQETHNNTEE